MTDAGTITRFKSNPHKPPCDASKNLLRIRLHPWLAEVKNEAQEVEKAAKHGSNPTSNPSEITDFPRAILELVSAVRTLSKVTMTLCPLSHWTGRNHHFAMPAFVPVT